MMYFVAVTDDELEFPLCIADTQSGLAEYLGIGSGSIYTAMNRASDGIVHCNGKRRGIKYFRMDAETGEIIQKPKPLRGFAALRAELGMEYC